MGVLNVILEKALIPQLHAPTRLSDLKIRLFNSIQSRAGLKKALDKNQVLLNGSAAKTADIVSGGETLELLMAENTKPKKPSIELNISVLFEDDYLAVVEKPAGILVSGNKKWTLENALPFNLKLSTHQDALARPEPIHRLDYPTSGCLLIGKTASSVNVLNEMFKLRSINKTYHAVCIGEMPTSGTINSPIDDKESVSHFNVIATVNSARFKQLNLVELGLETGRRHQLRKHLASIGHPILGDKEYGTEGLILNGKGLYLHATRMRLSHPFTNSELDITCAIGKKYVKVFPEIINQFNLNA